MSTNAATDDGLSHTGLAPGQIEPTDTFPFHSADGTALYAEWFEAEQPRAAALIVHGYAEHCGRYREVANVLVSAKVSALSYDMRGHGRAEGQRGHVNGYSDFLADMNAALECLRERSGKLPVMLLTHSNGGLIALRALADPFRCPKGISCAVLSSPFLGLKAKVPAAKALVGKAAGRFVPTLSLPSELKIEHLTHDRDKLDERRVDTLCHDVASARWFTSALRAHEYVAELAHRVTVPTLWLVAGSDQIADPSASRRVHKRIRAPSAYHEFPGFYHEVMNEEDRGRVFDILRTYLDERFPL